MTNKDMINLIKQLEIQADILAAKKVDFQAVNNYRESISISDQIIGMRLFVISITKLYDRGAI